MENHLVKKKNEKSIHQEVRWKESFLTLFQIVRPEVAVLPFSRAQGFFLFFNKQTQSICNPKKYLAIAGYLNMQTLIPMAFSYQSSKCRLVFLHFNHHMMNIDDFISDLHVAKRPLAENLLESMIVLNQLCQGTLKSKYIWCEKINITLKHFSGQKK